MDLYLFFLLFFIINSVHSNPEEEDEKVEKVLRIQLEPNGLKLVTMSDGELIVTFELKPNGDINDCKSFRRRRMALGMLNYDVELNSGENDVVYYDDEDLDVQWYSRQCNRFLRKVSVPGETEFQDVHDKQVLNKGHPGDL